MRSLLLVSNIAPEKLGAYEYYLAECARHGREAGVRVEALLAGEPAPAAAAMLRDAGLVWRVAPGWVDAADREDRGAFVRAYLAALRRGPWDVAAFTFCSEAGVVRACVAARTRGLAPGATAWVQQSQMKMPRRAARWVSRLRLLRLAVDEFLTVSEADERSALARGWPAGRVTVTRNGVAPREPVDPAGVRPALGLPDGAVVILSVGSLIPRKGFDVLLAAAAPLLGADPPRHLVVAGDGPDRAELEALADRLGVARFVRWLGLRDDVPDLIAAADLFALASHAEGLTFAVVEAMAAGKPVVVTDVGGHREVVPPAAGWVVPPGDAPAFAAALRAAIDTLPAAAASAAGRRAGVAAAFAVGTQVKTQFEVFARASARHLALRPATPPGDSTRTDA